MNNNNKLLCIRIKKQTLINYDGSSSTGQVLDLLSRDHQFESYKSQGHWRLTWSLISRPVRLVEVRASWPGHPR